MREPRPTQQHWCKQCEKLTEHHTTKRTGSDRLELSDCTLCKHRNNQERQRKRAERKASTPGVVSRRIDSELAKRYGVPERRQREALPLPEPEPVRPPQSARLPAGPPYFGQLVEQPEPQQIGRPLAVQRREIALALAKLRNSGKLGWWTEERRVYPG